MHRYRNSIVDTLTSMKVFHTAVTNGSFSEAGRVLGMAPSSVSRQISALEDHLGVQLLNRSTRQLHLTENRLPRFTKI